MNQPGQQPDERREFFRVDDTVRLHIRRVPEDEVNTLEDRLARHIEGSFSVMASLATISAEMAVGLRRIENHDPDIAQYLKALDRKIDVLGRALLACESDMVEQQSREINLSAGGLSTLVRDVYQLGETLELKLLLFPSFTGVITYGKVVGMLPLEEPATTGYTHHLRVEFTHMRESDRDILIRHVLHCQSEALRRRAESVDQT